MAELFSQVLGLQEKDVFLETAVNDTTYFSITGLPPIMSYGKHPFTITFNDPTQGPLLKNLSNIIFEFVYSRFSFIFSNLMDIEELRSLVTNQIHEEIQEGENEYGQSGAFDEMIAWNEDVFLDVAKDFELEFEGV